jgi:6-hydroxycyclohex-1-ene-1-carbonyl-CoA dehydrogenase
MIGLMRNGRLERAAVGVNDLAIFVGVGGVGAFGVQIAAARGAAVVAIDIDDERLALAAVHGASLTINSRGMSLKELKNTVRAHGKSAARGETGWKIFETSGTGAGQETAFGLLDFGAYLAIVGFTPQKIELRLSNLMAFDATARGNWGCATENYPKALDLVLQKKVAIAPFVEIHPLDELPALFEAANNHKVRLRPVVTP